MSNSEALASTARALERGWGRLFRRRCKYRVCKFYDANDPICSSGPRTHCGQYKDFDLGPTVEQHVE